MKKIRSIDYRPIIIPKATIDIILTLNCKNKSSIIGLYSFYYYCGIWQKTNQPKAVTKFTAKALGISEDKVREYKKHLIELKLINDIQVTDNQGKVVGHYIAVNYYQSHPTRFPQSGFSHSVGNPQANAYNNNNKLNAYSSNMGTLFSERKKNKKDFARIWAERLVEVVEKKRIQKGRISISQWSGNIRKLFNLDGVKKKDIKKVIIWYCKNYNKQYTPSIYHSTDIRTKFQQLVEAMKRQQKENGEKDFETKTIDIKGKRTHIVDYN